MLKLACLRRILGRPQSAEDPERGESNECDPYSSIIKFMMPICSALRSSSA